MTIWRGSRSRGQLLRQISRFPERWKVSLGASNQGTYADGLVASTCHSASSFIRDGIGWAGYGSGTDRLQFDGRDEEGVVGTFPGTNKGVGLFRSVLDHGGV